MELDVETIGGVVAFVLTLMVYCYLAKDIPFFYAIYRVAAYTFVGVALAYGTIVAWHSVLVPRLWLRLEGGQWWYLVPLGLCLLLLTRVKRSWRGLGGVTIAFLFGVGVALAIGGGIAGTLLPQVEASFVSVNPNHYLALGAQEGNPPLSYALNALLVAIGTIATLMYFYYARSWRASEQPVSPGSGEGPSARPRSARLGDGIAHLSRGFGGVFLMFTFGALFATTAISRVSLLVDRVRFIIETIWSYIPVP
jgi:hypothetical protein